MNQSKSLQSSGLDHLSLVSTTELANTLKRKPQTIRMWLCNDRLPSGLCKPINLKKRNYWHLDDVINYLNSLQTINY